MNLILLKQILMKWSLENFQYDLTFYLFTIYKSSIPNKFLYKYLTNCNHLNISIENELFLMKIINSLKNDSKYCKINDNNEYGYIIKNTI
jgi:hypothetical protein